MPDNDAFGGHDTDPVILKHLERCVSWARASWKPLFPMNTFGSGICFSVSSTVHCSIISQSRLAFRSRST